MVNKERARELRRPERDREEERERTSLSFCESVIRTDFESSGNYLKRVIICARLDEVNPPVFKKPTEEHLKAIQRSILYSLKRPNPVFSLTPFSNYKVISSSLCLL